MIGPILALFTTSMHLTGAQRLLLMFPLCLSIAVVYKTTRCETVREIPASALVLWVTIVVGMLAVGFGFWALFMILV